MRTGRPAVVGPGWRPVRPWLADGQHPTGARRGPQVPVAVMLAGRRIRRQLPVCAPTGPPAPHHLVALVDGRHQRFAGVLGQQR